MVINNKTYNVSLNDVNRIRYILFTNFFNNFNYVEEFIGYINQTIDNLGIDFDPSCFRFIVKIKKTTMRKRSGFKHDPNYYYSSVQEIYRQFIIGHESTIIELLAKDLYNGDLEKARDHIKYLYQNSSILANLCHVSCMADNILVIDL